MQSGGLPKLSKKLLVLYLGPNFRKIWLGNLHGVYVRAKLANIVSELPLISRFSYGVERSNF